MILKGEDHSHFLQEPEVQMHEEPDFDEYEVVLGLGGGFDSP